MTISLAHVHQPVFLDTFHAYSSPPPPIPHPSRFWTRLVELFLLHLVLIRALNPPPLLRTHVCRRPSALIALRIHLPPLSDTLVALRSSLSLLSATFCNLVVMNYGF